MRVYVCMYRYNICVYGHIIYICHCVNSNVKGDETLIMDKKLNEISEYLIPTKYGTIQNLKTQTYLITG